MDNQSLEDRRKIMFNILPLLLTAIIAVATCFASYFSYRSVQLASEQNDREARKELIQWVTLLRDTIESARAFNSEVQAAESDTQQTEQNSN